MGRDFIDEESFVRFCLCDHEERDEDAEAD